MRNTNKILEVLDSYIQGKGKSKLPVLGLFFLSLFSIAGCVPLAIVSLFQLPGLTILLFVALILTGAICCNFISEYNIRIKEPKNAIKSFNQRKKKAEDSCQKKTEVAKEIIKALTDFKEVNCSGYYAKEIASFISQEYQNIDLDKLFNYFYKTINEKNPFDNEPSSSNGLWLIAILIQVYQKLLASNDEVLVDKTFNSFLSMTGKHNYLASIVLDYIDFNLTPGFNNLTPGFNNLTPGFNLSEKRQSQILNHLDRNKRINMKKLTNENLTILNNYIQDKGRSWIPAFILALLLFTFIGGYIFFFAKFSEPHYHASSGHILGSLSPFMILILFVCASFFYQCYLLKKVKENKKCFNTLKQVPETDKQGNQITAKKMIDELVKVKLCDNSVYYAKAISDFIVEKKYQKAELNELFNYFYKAIDKKKPFNNGNGWTKELWVVPAHLTSNGLWLMAILINVYQNLLALDGKEDIVKNAFQDFLNMVGKFDNLARTVLDHIDLGFINPQKLSLIFNALLQGHKEQQRIQIGKKRTYYYQKEKVYYLLNYFNKNLEKLCRLEKKKLESLVFDTTTKGYQEFIQTLDKEILNGIGFLIVTKKDKCGQNKFLMLLRNICFLLKKEKESSDNGLSEESIKLLKSINESKIMHSPLLDNKDITSLKALVKELHDNSVAPNAEEEGVPAKTLKSNLVISSQNSGQGNQESSAKQQEAVEPPAFSFLAKFSDLSLEVDLSSVSMQGSKVVVSEGVDNHFSQEVEGGPPGKLLLQ